MSKKISECLMEGDEMHPEFEHLNPSGIDNSNKEAVKKEKMLNQLMSET